MEKKLVELPSGSHIEVDRVPYGGISIESGRRENAPAGTTIVDIDGSGVLDSLILAASWYCVWAEITVDGHTLQGIGNYVFSGETSWLDFCYLNQHHGDDGFWKLLTYDYENNLYVMEMKNPLFYGTNLRIDIHVGLPLMYDYWYRLGLYEKNTTTRRV